VRHASPPDTDRTENIPRADGGHTGHLPAAQPASCPVIAHPFLRQLGACWFWCNVVATLAIWSALLLLAVFGGTRLAVILWSWHLT
jgi:hypothetical protein